MTAMEQGTLGLDSQPCRECGTPIPYYGKGRRRRVCDACRPDWWPGVVREPTNIPRPLSGQSDVAPHPRHRATDPPTSRAAARSITPGRTEDRILGVLGDDELTADEITARLPGAYQPTIVSALSRMTQAGLVVVVGTRESARGRARSVFRAGGGE